MDDTINNEGHSAETRCRGRLVWPLLFTPTVIAAAIVAVYANALFGPMILDDSTIITQNPTIRGLGQVVRPPRGGFPVSGRPVFNVSLALSYALGRENVLGYHLFNVVLHILNALFLFGILRRTLCLPSLSQRVNRRSTLLAFIIALLWGLHPLATSAVDYISQRSELLMAFFYLLTLYCVIRSSTGAHRFWQAVAVLACALGMASKEVMVSAPLVALLYDRVFLSRSWKEYFRRRGLMYAGLAATWLLLAMLVASNGTRGDTAGFGGEISPWHYALTQCQALVLYLKLSFWPSPLVFDYGSELLQSLRQVWPQALLVLALLTVVVLSFRWQPWLGFLGVMWFAVLAPTSSIVPIRTQTIAEHRAYLPLAAVLAAVVVGAYHVGARLVGRRASWLLGIAAVVATGTCFGGLTALRSRDYHTKLSIWEDTVRKRPLNARAYGSLAKAHFELGDYDAAIANYTQVIRLKPRLADSYNNRGSAYMSTGRYEDAIVDFSQAIYLEPSFAEAYYNRGNAYLSTGRYELAIADCTQAIYLKPDLADAYYNRGNAYLRGGRSDPAIADYAQAIRLKPDFAEAYNNRANAYMSERRYQEAIADCTRALQRKPDYLDAYNNRGLSHMFLREYDKAWSDFGMLRKFGGTPNAEVIAKLRELSGRSE